MHKRATAHFVRRGRCMSCNPASAMAFTKNEKGHPLSDERVDTSGWLISVDESGRYQKRQWITIKGSTPLCCQTGQFIDPGISWLNIVTGNMYLACIALWTQWCLAWFGAFANHFLTNKPRNGVDSSFVQVPGMLHSYRISFGCICIHI